MRLLGTRSARTGHPSRTRPLRPWRTPPRLATIFALIMVFGSLVPATSMDIAASPQSDSPAATGQQQITGTASLEIDVVRCPDGFDPNDLFGTCHSNGIPDVDVQIASVDTALGIAQSQTTDTSAGPGRTSFADLPAGDYTVTVNLVPETGVRYYVYCGISGGGDPLPPTPDDALSTVVTVPDGAPVACDFYVIPTEAGEAPPATGDIEESTIDLFAFTCEAGFLPGDGEPEFEDFEQACTEEASGVEFHLVTDDNTDTVQTTDDDGESEFTYPAGAPVRFYSGVPLEAEEFLFCALDDGDAENVTIDVEGVSTFDNATAEDRTCSWFLVEEDTAATETPTVQPTGTATEQPTESPTVAPTEVPANDSSIELTAFTCAFDAIADPDAASFGDFEAACGAVAPDIDFNLDTGELQFDESTGDNGQVAFTYPVGNEVDFFAAVPLEADEYLFCATDDDPEASLVEMNAQGVAEFDNATAEARTCSWFLIQDAPATEVPTEAPTVVPTGEPTIVPPAQPTDEPVAPPAAEGEISVLPLACPVDYDPETQGAGYDALSANCTEGVEDVSFDLGSENGDQDVRVADGQNPIVYGPLASGAYTLYSDVPLDAADEYVFCTADGGNRYEKELTDRGVTTFGELESEQIACEWYIVPTSQRGDESGGSLEIHLAVCPVGYTGDSIFDDCHGEGLADFEFSLEGPGGTQTATTEIPQTPGPGIATFTGLAAGDYTFFGGPPGDFGEVELFCSTQPDNGAADYAIDGAVGSLTLAENQDVLCDWYFIPEDGSGQTPTPTPTATPEPERAEILVTLYACPPAASQSGTYGGATLDTFDNECTETVDDVTFRLGDPNSAPLSAKTGASGDGAVRFFDLLPGDLTMTPSLPSNLTSAAVFCSIDDGTVYQKALSNGGTTFVDVNGESIECSWYAVEDREEPAPGPTGSITIREYLCEDDRSEITDWDAECAPGSTGTSYTIANTSTDSSAEGTPGEDGVYVFAGLANGFYTLDQNTGNWCRAVADRVDSESRVIVEGGGNTDVVLYQCNAVEGLPDTGTGPGGTIVSDGSPLTGTRLFAIALALLAVPLAWSGWLHMRKRRTVSTVQPAEPRSEPRVAANGRVQMRFR